MIVPLERITQSKPKHILFFVLLPEYYIIIRDSYSHKKFNA